MLRAAVFSNGRNTDAALQLDFDTVIPGHGPISLKDDVKKFRSDLETMRNVSLASSAKAEPRMTS
jgi:hypothetical protein